jgi:isopenicillin-N N-acyltransferase like protein
MATGTHEAVILEGDGRGRGHAHGEQLRERIAAALDALESDIARRTGRLPAEHVRDFLAATGFLPTIQERTPDLLQEVRGIAEGANADFPLVLAHNLLDEEWWYSESTGQSCSVLAVAPEEGRSSLLAQNMDLPAWTDGSQVVLHCRDPQGDEAVLLSMAGMIGLTGVNSRGLGLCVNALGMLRHSASGLPVAFAMRGALDQPTRERAAAFLATTPHASGQHFALADQHGIRGLECSAGGAQAIVSGPRTWHANHPLATEDVDPASELPEGTADSHVRQERLADLVPEVEKPEDCMEVLCDGEAPICKHATASFPWLTFGSVVYELTASPRAWFALGPPDRTPFVRHDPA